MSEFLELSESEPVSVALTSQRIVVSFMSAIESNIVVLEANVGISGIVGI